MDRHVKPKTWEVPRAEDGPKLQWLSIPSWDHRHILWSYWRELFSVKLQQNKIKHLVGG